MSFDSMSLETISGLKVITTLITCSDKVIKLASNVRRENGLILLKECVYGIYSEVQLPAVLLTKLKILAQYIGFEFLKFCFYLKGCISINLDFLNELILNLCWKTKGIIDRKKTIERLIGDTTLSLSIRYRLACVFCFEEDVLKIWCMLSEDEKSHFLTISDPLDPILDNISIWSLNNGKQEIILSTNATKLTLESVCSYCVTCSLQNGNPEAFLYYWKLLPQEEKRHVINYNISKLENINYPDAIPYEEINECFDGCITDEDCKLLHEFFIGNYTDLVVCLILEIDDEELKIFQNELQGYIVFVLKQFLVWKNREHFIFVFEKLQSFMKAEEYVDMIKLLEENISKFSKLGDHYYLNLLENVWRKSATTNKISIYFWLPHLLFTVLYFGGRDLAFLILNDLSVEKKTNVLFSDLGKDICKQLARDKKWNFLKIYIDMCVPKEKLDDFRSLFFNPSEQETSSSSREPVSEKDDYTSEVYNFLVTIVQKRVFDNEKV